MNGSTRLQPVVLQIGQAAGALAALSVKQNKAIADVSVRDVQNELLNAGGYLLPYLDLKKEDIHFKAVQRIGSTGILKGIGMNVGWSNETWFRTDSILLADELRIGLKEFEPSFEFSFSENEITLKTAFEIIKELSRFHKLKELTDDTFKTYWNLLQLEQFDANRKITRKEFAVLLDYSVNPFYLKEINISGNYK